ncbi:hypothetical protein LZV53_22040 [Klebsiella michiganensis]|uniref:hypothetical protein n=1 Tax=Klebsiella michiganensis TaxID=1134687 RepID=UPI001F166EE3|nr:hypothetical protein [Klebsiella michiganensis]MCE7547227.1 hypothetical protein [Klebsiella michiganensis]
MTDITELAQNLKAAAEKAKHAGEAPIMSFDARISALNEYLITACPGNILALVEALERAQQEAEELSKFKEVMTSAANALKAGKPLNLESLFKGELVSAMFAMMFAGEFVRSGATNYLELLYDVPEFGEMTITLQKVEGKTPGQRIAELESRTVTVNLASRRLPSDYVDGEFSNDDLAAIHNACRLECKVSVEKYLSAHGIVVKWEDE